MSVVVIDEPTLPSRVDFIKFNPSGFPCNCSKCVFDRLHRFGIDFSLVDIYGNLHNKHIYMKAVDHHQLANERWRIRITKMNKQYLKEWSLSDYPIGETNQEKTERLAPCVFNFVSPDEMMEITRAMCDDAHKRARK